MRFSALIGAAVLPLAVSAGSHVAGHARRHHDLAARNPQPLNLTERDIEKRSFSGRFTFYDVGL